MRLMILLGMILLSTLIITVSCGADEKSSCSQGCGRAAPASLPTSLRVGGHTREFISVVPESYDARIAHRLIFAFHGRTTPNTRVRKYYRIEQNSKKLTIFVYPAGLIAAAAMIIHNPNDDLVPVSRGLEARGSALAQNGLEPPPRECKPRELNCQCYGPPGTPDPVVWCPHTEDYYRRGKYYPHLWPKYAGTAIMGFFDSLPARTQ